MQNLLMMALLATSISTANAQFLKLGPKFVLTSKKLMEKHLTTNTNWVITPDCLPK